MKPAKILILATALIFAGFSAEAAIFGVPTVVGEGCSKNAEQLLTPVANQPERFSIANQILLIKSNSPMVARKSCQFRLPVSLGANEKLVVSDVSQFVRLNVSKGVTAKTSLEVFLAGQHGNPLTAEARAITGPIKNSQVLRSSGVVAESACGQDVILAGNSTASAVGSARATVLGSDVQLNIQIRSCN